MPPPGGFPKDLATMNLTGWAGLIQDVAQEMKVVPPNLSMEVYLDSMVLLQLLEATTGMGYCRICCQPTPSCLCPGAYQSVPIETWSQMMARIPGQGVAASTGGSTTSEASTMEVQELGVISPPLGLTPLDFTNWSLPLPGAPLTGGLPLPSGGLPGIRRQTAGPQALGPWAPTPPMQVPSTPQGMLLIHQQRLHQPAAPYQQVSQPAALYQQVVQQMSQPAAPYQQVAQQASQPAAPYQQAVQQVSQPAAPYQQVVQQVSQPAAPYQQVVQQVSQPTAPYQQVLQRPSQPTTPYQQAMQPLRSPAGRGGEAQLPSSSAASTARQPTQERGRQPTRGRGLRGRSASRPGRGQGSAADAATTTTPGATPPQPGHRTRTRCFDPAQLATKYRSSGWRKDLEHVLKVYYRYNLQAPFDELEWVRVRELFFDRFVVKKAKALRIKEESPLDYMPFIVGEFYGATGIRLYELQDFTGWIKRGSYYHRLLVH